MTKFEMDSMSEVNAWIVTFLNGGVTCKAIVCASDTSDAADHVGNRLDKCEDYKIIKVEFFQEAEVVFI